MTLLQERTNFTNFSTLTHTATPPTPSPVIPLPHSNHIQKNQSAQTEEDPGYYSSGTPEEQMKQGLNRDLDKMEGETRVHNNRLYHAKKIKTFKSSRPPLTCLPTSISVTPPPPPLSPAQPPPPAHTPGLPDKPNKFLVPPSKVERVENEGRSLEGEREYRCEERGCGRAFCRNEELTRHLRIHSGHRPFTCQKCGRRFVRRDHLTKHQRTHLPTHVKRSYTCPLPACTHRYTRSDALTRHMWTAHHVRARQPARASRPRPLHPTPPPRPHTTTTTTTTSSLPVLKMEVCRL
ncbi:Krueppel-like factor 9 [Portunus trituberculatus]|uniref:Krueppel-like factor 9 n=1 Tax=Portunus trituberculatus TaxID=210409 RepID=UPI001E1D0C5E|nr:Krueppel-like factor 9 [Portunus trituberculatus]